MTIKHSGFIQPYAPTGTHRLDDDDFGSEGGAVASRLVRSPMHQAVPVEPWPETLCFVLGQDTLLSQLLSPPCTLSLHPGGAL